MSARFLAPYFIVRYAHSAPANIDYSLLWAKQGFSVSTVPRWACRLLSPETSGRSPYKSCERQSPSPPREPLSRAVPPPFFFLQLPVQQTLSLRRTSRTAMGGESSFLAASRSTPCPSARILPASAHGAGQYAIVQPPLQQFQHAAGPEAWPSSPGRVHEQHEQGKAGGQER